MKTEKRENGQNAKMFKWSKCYNLKQSKPQKCEHCQNAKCENGQQCQKISSVTKAAQCLGLSIDTVAIPDLKAPANH